MKKILVVSAVALSLCVSSSFIAFNSYAIENVVSEKLATNNDKVKSKNTLKTHQLQKTLRTKDAKDFKDVKDEKKDNKEKDFFNKLKENEQKKRTISKLPIFAKYRPIKYSKGEECVKNGHHIIINKKKRNTLCNHKHS